MTWKGVMKRVRYTDEGVKIIRIFNEYTQEIREIARDGRMQKLNSQEQAKKLIDAYSKHVRKLEDMFEIKE